jgi:hypothetical protein
LRRVFSGVRLPRFRGLCGMNKTANIITSYSKFQMGIESEKWAVSNLIISSYRKGAALSFLCVDGISTTDIYTSRSPSERSVNLSGVT